MSREIKYKAWLKDAKYFAEIRHISFFEGKTVVKIYDQPMSEEVWFELEDLELLQFTGLKDKNDVEIYEGDIVIGYYDEFDPYFEETNRHTYTSRILYINNAFCVNRDTVNEEGRIRNYGYQKDWDCETIEVIGNIYENKKLIGGKMNE